MNILIIQISTNDMRGVVFNENSDVRYQTETQYHPWHFGEGIVEQNPLEWFGALNSICRSSMEFLNAGGESLAAIVYTCLRSSIIPVDENGKALRNAIMWMDTRNAEYAQALVGQADRLYALSGSVPNTVFSGTKMRWVIDHEPEIYKQTYKFCTIGDYLNYAMTGEFRTDYTYAGQYTPYLEMADLPLELCSLQIAFLVAMLLVKKPEWRSRLRALMYVTGVIGGTLGIVLAEVTVDYTAVAEYFTSPRIYQFFLYHSMVVTLGLYMGFGPDSDVSLRRFRGTMGLLLALDVPTFYLNSVFSQPVYVAGKPEGIVYRTNFFSSYVNPVGLVLTQRWQWLAYLAIRLVLAASLIAFLLLLATISRKRRLNYRPDQEEMQP